MKTGATTSYPKVPLGFRFHPTEEELVDYYLKRKVSSRQIDLDVIKDVDLYNIEPWDLKEICRIGSEEQSQWYFFSHKDKKYPTGTRTNRATAAGFWKATGRDKAIYSKNELIGMRKTLVFYKGRAPRGLKSDWIMHEYRLQTHENGPPHDEGWVVCRVFTKRMTMNRKFNDQDFPTTSCFDDRVSFMSEIEHNHHHHRPYFPSPYIKMDLAYPEMDIYRVISSGGDEMCNDRVTDWRVLDKFVASQLSHDKNETFERGEEANVVVKTREIQTEKTSNYYRIGF